MNKPIPILFTIPNFITAGSGNAMLNIVRSLDRKKYFPAVCVLKKGGYLDKEVDKLGIPFLEIPFSILARPYSTLIFRAWKIAQIFKPYKFKIWHSFHYLDDYTEPLIAKLAGAQNWIYTKKNMNWGTRAWKIRSFLAAGIAVQNSAMLDLFFKGVKKNVEVIPPGVDIVRYFPVNQKKELKEKLGLAPSDILVGHSAHFVPVKNHPHLVRAVAGCQNKNTHFVFAGRMGDDQYSAEIRKLVKDLNLEKRVHFLGEVQNMPEFLNSLDIFAFCSHREACPVAVLEAMACGLPCVVTDIPGIRDMHIQRKTCIAVPPKDLEGFSAALDELAGSESLRNMMGKEAILRIKEKFSIRIEIDQYTQFYERLLR